MRFLNLTLDDAAANVALDEALLETAEASEAPLEVLRLWEAKSPLVVLGRSSEAHREARLEACRELGAPLVRRSSGGLSVVAGPGCLMYALVLSYELRPALRLLDIAHREILGTMVAALRPLAPEIAVRGTSDLEVDGRKVSGNSVRCKRRALLYHGTLLYDFPLALIGRLLEIPPRAPDYRAGRSHDDFVANLPATADALRKALIDAWQAHEPLDAWPQALTKQLVAEKYGADAWTFRH